MKRQEITKFQAMSIADLQAEIKKLEIRLTEITMKKSLAQIKNIREGAVIRHDIARFKTIIRAKELRV